MRKNIRTTLILLAALVAVALPASAQDYQGAVDAGWGLSNSNSVTAQLIGGGVDIPISESLSVIGNFAVGFKDGQTSASGGGGARRYFNRGANRPRPFVDISFNMNDASSGFIISHAGAEVPVGTGGGAVRLYGGPTFRVVGDDTGNLAGFRAGASYVIRFN